MLDILKTIGEILIALFILRYLIHIYNTLGRTREPVRKALADISTYKAQREATLYHLYVIAEQFSQRESNTLTQASLANMSRQNANFQALAAAYPELKSNQTYLSLMDSVGALELRIQASRHIMRLSATIRPCAVRFPTACWRPSLALSRPNTIKKKRILKPVPPKSRRLRTHCLRSSKVRSKRLCRNRSIIVPNASLKFINGKGNSVPIGAAKTQNARPISPTTTENRSSASARPAAPVTCINGRCPIRTTGRAATTRTARPSTLPIRRY